MATIGDFPASASITVELRRTPTVCLVRVVGDIDIDGVEPMRAALSEAARTGTPVVLDCTETTFADSSFLNTALHALRSVPVHLAGATGMLASLLKVTGTDEVFRLHPDVATALRECARQEEGAS
ncbi:STAS domain-containing protein [Streptomyces sp. NPDC101181]|uniref:STAS domain-containing protein n=1 Tax=Streptomyces sp. NPDC101181 TaxID=3366125 RepID=UPI00381C5E74